ncbi:hypothetical protein FLAK523_11700 [Flavobacterium sp. K5-23]|nr:hypothetical protein FLAK523_11700 [Flavobacterium sp. K5-23]
MKHCLLSLIILFSFTNLSAQNEMFIGQLSGRTVIRENFDKKGDLLNKQTFEVGQVKKANDYYIIQVVTKMFDKSGKFIDKYATSYRCSPNESSVMVMVFPFSNPKSKKTEINTTSENFKGLYDLDNLQDVEMEMNFDSGLLNFFGAKSTIKIYDRVLESDVNGKKIKSKLRVKAYALGIRIKQFKYTVIEKLTDKGLLSFQKFTEEDASYFTMTYK